jgi:NADPH:quinone reductase-like Zn-dependent oxidoreductase
VADPPAPSGDEVVVEVRAAGVANWDNVIRRGEWDVGIEPPMALGVEAAGVVAAVGDAVDGWLPATRSSPIRSRFASRAHGHHG